jgi:4-hydroxybenzoate polyprenyltransferase
MKIPILLGLGKRPSAYNVTVGLLVFAVVVASAIEPPTAYLIPLAVAAWGVAYWTLKRETSPRYRRNTNN